MSNVIKSNRYVSTEEIRKLQSLAQRTPEPPQAEPAPEEPAVSEHQREIEAAADRIVQDAKIAAEEMLRSASEEAEQMKAGVSAEIEKWWDERRLEDLRVVEESRQSGFDAGYREGLQQAEKEITGQYETLLTEARELVEEAHRVKERVISEAEPFLVELSAAIARKIIGEHIQLDPEWTIAHVKRTLARRREKGLITLCVAPSQFAKMQDARSELTLAVDSQADLKIVPDATVDVGGCVVRSAFGSIDARIDSQLSELKNALMDVAAQSKEGAEW